MAEPGAKRKRTEGVLPTISTVDATLVRSQIWMPYGDIILQAESTLFRVNRDVLAQQSSVFCDMFSIPQPPNEPTVDGCPVVHVSDKAKDWKMLFGVLYNSFRYYNAALPFNILAPMLRLGRKYDFSAAKDNAVWRIRFEFPGKLEAWSGVSAELTKIGPCQLTDLLCLTYECGVTSSIPALAFCCLREQTLEYLLTEIQHDDGSRSTLPDHIRLTLAIALERIASFQRATFAWLEDASVIPHHSCTTQMKCTNQRRTMHHDLTFLGGNELVRCYGLDDWNDDWEDEFCVVCSGAGETAFSKSRKMVWEALPMFFGLPGWKDLKDD
ncbi:hypothetical protein B0H15DRAFT_818094 [Mycena belliarum]|uniref:BTB domain-containing protein n=1 Tax=Mycena belliarum TaxID=1033014 RepID=A0AAD6UDT7_9AGAR|nr:hypothetical protein B0H15DRAFT_818094 [Mycena belliae]